METTNSKTPNPPKDEEIDRLRALFARINEPRPPKGIRNFFHDLAERSAQPSKRVIVERIRKAS